ncbi:hypothetical protein ORJ66_21135 [Pseudoalteromonas tunicata]|uniref:hypothetical protein n=1 Tax=Pseudoalteromonas tunicata TaxID=314281 RepID=UPI00273F87D9|nr:hypothetical protein [Pseudoalteromonas tunicata]MDP5215552.1 hypothetical protein [Pseudoalteromonas tunicata]
MSLEFLSDWKFWSFTVAFAALILSQLPPINLWFKKAKLDLELYSRVHLTHKVGNPNVQMHMIIRNVGGRNVRIKSINIDIERDGKLVDSLEAQNYLPDPLNNQSVLFTSFSLEPNSEWSNRVNLLNFFDREEEKVYKNSEKNLREEILRLRKDLAENDKTIVQASDGFVKPFIEFFNKKFIWQPGDYKFHINIITASEDVYLKKSFRFTLFESQSDDLKSYAKDFNSGYGIMLDTNDHSGVLIQIEEKDG